VLNSSTTNTVNATYNWWGSASGPYHATTNPGGNTRSQVSSYVNYGSYLQSPILPGAPLASALSPTNNATNVAVSTAVTATFNEAMDPTTITESTFLVSNATGSVTYDAASMTATFTPSVNLASSTTYTVTLTTGMKDLSGDSLASDYQWSFVTSCPTITLSPASLPSVTANIPYSQTITTSGGTGPYTISITAGSLPAGLGFLQGTQTSADISGTPTVAGTYNFTVTATDANSCIGSQAYSLTVANTACVAPQSGLVAWWQGEGNANDQMSASHGTIVSNVTFTTGVVGQAFSFDGATGYIATPYTQSSVTAYSVSAWIRTTDATPSNTVIVQDRGSGSGISLTLGVGSPYAGAGRVFFLADSTNTALGIHSATTVNDGIWHHVVGTWSAPAASGVNPSQFTLYIDGIAETEIVQQTTGSTTSPLTGLGGLRIGHHEAWNTFFNGDIDEVQLYNRVLTATEVADSYNAGTNGLCDTISPTVKSTNPASSATNVSVSSPVTITFSEAMDPATITNANLKVVDALLSSVSGTVAYDSASNTATFTPSSSLTFTALYTASVSTGVQDVAGNALASAYTWTFTTSDHPSCSWNNASGGSWNSSANWSCGYVPNSTDDVFITLDGTYTVTLDTSATVNSLTVGGASGMQTLSQNGNTLTLNNASGFGANGAYLFSGGTVTGSGALTVANMTWSGGTMGGAGATNIVSGGTLTISGTVSLDTRTLNNSGTVVRTSNLTIYFYNSSVINNQSGGVFDIRNDPTFSVQSGSSAFNNAGTFKKSAGTGTATISTDFNNTGTVDVQSGTLSLNSGGTSTSGNFNAVSGATLQFVGGTHNQIGRAHV
jgi:hypothetical protein